MKNLNSIKSLASKKNQKFQIIEAKDTKALKGGLGDPPPFGRG